MTSDHKKAPGPNGRIMLRLPKSLHKKCVELAKRENTSLNQFILGAVAERVGATQMYHELADRLEQK